MILEERTTNTIQSRQIYGLNKPSVKKRLTDKQLSKKCYSLL